MYWAPSPLGNRHKNQSQIAKRFGLSRGGEARSRISVDMSAFNSPADVLRDRYRGGGLTRARRGYVEQSDGAVGIDVGSVAIEAFGVTGI